MLNKIKNTWMPLLLVAGFCLAANDVVRLCGFAAGNYVEACESASDEENNQPGNSYNWVEEESKNKLLEPIHPGFLVKNSSLSAAVVPLIQDDKVRHLAFMPVFSPPPDQL